MSYQNESRTVPLGIGTPRKLTVEDKILLPSTSFGGVLEVTLNLPRVKGFVNAKQDEQRAMYCRRWRQIIHSVSPLGTGLLHRCTYEVCKTGHVHLHGIIYLPVDKKYFVDGIVADVVKTYLQTLPRRYSTYKDGCMNKKFPTYRSPSISCSYVYKDDLTRINHWEGYINKCV